MPDYCKKNINKIHNTQLTTYTPIGILDAEIILRAL